MNKLNINTKTLEYLEREFLAYGDKIEINIYSDNKVNLILHYRKELAIINLFFKKKSITSLYLYVIHTKGEMKTSFPVKKNYPLRDWKQKELETLKIKTILKDYLKL